MHLFDNFCCHNNPAPPNYINKPGYLMLKTVNLRPNG